eukprot:4778219-Heterocapsa_arctica.AAC.1
MASQPSTSSGPTNVGSPASKRMAFQAFAGGEMVSAGDMHSSAQELTSMMTSVIVSSPAVDTISL